MSYLKRPANFEEHHFTVANRRLYFSSIFLGAFIIAIPAFINNFPFLYVDTGTYLYNGYSNEISTLRPLMYGLFIRHISLEESLWIVIAVQCLIVSWTINRFIKTFAPQAHAFFSILVISTLVFTSGIGVVAGMLMPDFLTTVMILLTGVLLFSEKPSFKSFVLPCLVLFFAIPCHHSHPYILFCILIGTGVIHLLLKIKKRKLISWQRFLLVFCIGVLGFYTIPYLHYVRKGEFMRSKSTNVFIMGRINQMGLLESFLNKHCPEKKYPICAYKDALPIDFLWSDQSPVHKDGGWDVNNEKYKEVVSDFFHDPLYAKKFFIKSFETVIQQFFSFDLVVITQQKRGEFLHDTFKLTVPEYIPAIENALQYKNQWSNAIVNPVQKVIVFSCFLLLVYLFLYQNTYYINPLYQNLFLLIFLGLLANAFICGCISMVDPRFQSRVIWLLPFYTMLLLYHLKTEKEKT